MDWVRKEGLGNDATTCCKSTFRQWCQDMCTEYSGIPEQECMGDCEAQYGAFGISLDSCYVPVLNRFHLQAQQSAINTRIWNRLS